MEIYIGPIKLPVQYTDGLLGLQRRLAEADLRDGKISWRDYLRFNNGVAKLIDVDNTRAVYNLPGIISSLQSADDMNREMSKMHLVQTQRGMWIIPGIICADMDQRGRYLSHHYDDAVVVGPVTRVIPTEPHFLSQYHHSLNNE